MARSAVTNRRAIGNIPYALSFSGSQRVVLDTMGTLGSSLVGAFSFGIYVKTGSRLTTAQYMFGASNNVGGTYLFSGMTRSATRVGKWNVNFRDRTGRTLLVEALERNINTSEYLLLIFTKDATNTPTGCTMTINGVAQTVTSVTNTGFADPDNFDRTMAIGSSLGSGAVANGWVGNISRPFFFTRELTQQEKSDWWYKKIVPANEFAGYNFNAGSGTAIADTIGAHNGTLTADTQWTTDTPYKSRVTRQF